MWPEIHLHHHLVSESPRLRPTQMSVGLAEVAAKRREWAALGDKQRHKRCGGRCSRRCWARASVATSSITITSGWR